MEKCEYEFSEVGIEKMYNDSQEMVLDVLTGDRTDFNISELDIFVSIGDKQIKIPIYADGFEMIFDCLRDIRDNMAD